MRLIAFFVLLAALVLATWLIWGGGWEEKLTLDGSIRWLEGAGSWAWAAGVLLLLADLVLPVPGTIVMSALGYLYGPVLGGIFAAAGSMAAGLAGYGIGRACGEPFARRWLGTRDFEKGKAVFARGGGWMVAFTRALPILPEAITCTAGLVRMPFRRFLLALACGSVPTGFLFALIGSVGRVNPIWALISSVLLPLLLWAIARRRV